MGGLSPPIKVPLPHTGGASRSLIRVASSEAKTKELKIGGKKMKVVERFNTDMAEFMMIMMVCYKNKA